MQPESTKRYAPLAIRSCLTLLALTASTTVFANPWIEEVRNDPEFIEVRVSGMPYPAERIDRSTPYLLLSCRNKVFSFVLNWQESVGKSGELRRHLFYHVDGDNHLMLPVVDENGRTTGYLNQSDKAKSLVHEIFSTLTSDVIPIGVFPAGADPFTGEWVDAWLPSAAFKEAVLSVAKVCKFDPTSPRPDSHSEDKIPPAPPGWAP